MTYDLDAIEKLFLLMQEYQISNFKHGDLEILKTRHAQEKTQAEKLKEKQSSYLLGLNK